MARRRRNDNQLLRRAGLETRVKFGPERRALDELEMEGEQQLRHEVKSSQGTAQGIAAMINEVTPQTKQAYRTADASLDAIDADVEATGGLSGLFEQAAAREQAGQRRQLETGRAMDIADLGEQKVRAHEGALHATRNAFSQYNQDRAQLDRSRIGLAQDAGAFKAATFEDLASAEDQYGVELARLQLARREDRRSQRNMIADITGIDPATGLPTADERERREDGPGKRGPSAGEKSKHQGIVEEIQEARERALDLRRDGGKWSEIATILTGPKDKDHPSGGHGGVVTRAALELERHGKLSTSTTRALKARGLLPKRAPRSWRKMSPNERLAETGREGLEAGIGLFG